MLKNVVIPLIDQGVFDSADHEFSLCSIIASKTYHLFLLISLLSSLLIFFPHLSIAESPIEFLSEMSLEELMDLPVNSVGFFDVPLERAPGSIWILDKEILATVPAMNLKDILQFTVPGIQVSNHSIFGALYASRGCPMFDNSTSQFMWDGMNINSAGSLGINASLKSSLLGDIDRLEVSNGPASIIHGNGAINGFVNQVPKSGSSYPGARVSIVTGLTDSLIKTEAGYGYVYGVDRDLYLYTGVERADGVNMGNDFGYNDYAKAGSIPDDISFRSKDEPNYRFSLNWNHNNFRVIGFIQKEWLSSDGYYNGLLDSPELYYKTIVLRPAVTIPLTSTENLSIDFPMAFFDTGYISTFSRNNLLSDHGNSDMRVETNWILRSTRWENQQWATGFKLSSDHYRNNRYYFRSDPPSSTLGEDVDWKELSFFTEDIVEIIPGWTVTAGMRFDAIRYEVDESLGVLGEVVKNSEKLFPRIATSIGVGENSMVKLSFQEGFHYPPATALFSDNLDPEFLETYEINFLHSIPQTGIDITLNGFFNVYKDAMLAESGNLRGNQRSDFGSTGGEVMVEWKGEDSSRVMISYAYTRPLDLSENGVFVYTANSDLSAWLCYPSHSIKTLVSRTWLHDTIMTSLGFEYGSRVDQHEDPWYESRDLFDQDRFSLNFKTTFALSEHLSLSLVINNMVDNDVPVPSYLYLNPWDGNLGSTETRCYVGLTWQ